MDSKIDFMWACKDIYLAGTHPFDFDTSNTLLYQKVVSLGKEAIQEDGIQSFMGSLMEGQYRVHVWTIYIGLEYGNPDRNEILKISGKETIVNHCLKMLQRIVPNYDEGIIKQNMQKWISAMKEKYSVE